MRQTGVTDEIDQVAAVHFLAWTLSDHSRPHVVWGVTVAVGNVLQASAH